MRRARNAIDIILALMVVSAVVLPVIGALLFIRWVLL